MKDEILLQKMLAREDIQALDEKAKTYSKVIDGLKIF